MLALKSGVHHIDKINSCADRLDQREEGESSMNNNGFIRSNKKLNSLQNKRLEIVDITWRQSIIIE